MIRRLLLGLLERVLPEPDADLFDEHGFRVGDIPVPAVVGAAQLKDRMVDELAIGDQLIPNYGHAPRDFDRCRSIQPTGDEDPYVWPHLCTRPPEHKANHATFTFRGTVVAVWPAARRAS